MYKQKVHDLILFEQGVTGHRMDLYWSPRRNIRGIKFRHVIGLFGIKARWPSGDHLIQRNRENGLFI